MIAASYLNDKNSRFKSVAVAALDRRCAVHGNRRLAASADWHIEPTRAVRECDTCTIRFTVICGIHVDVKDFAAGAFDVIGCSGNKMDSAELSASRAISIQQDPSVPY